MEKYIKIVIIIFFLILKDYEIENNTIYINKICFYKIA